MSRALQTLARLQRAQIDDAKHVLSGIVAARAALAERDAALVAVMAAEQAAARDAAGAAAYGAYAPRVVDERRRLADEEAQQERRETVVRAQLADAYVELKKIELLLAAQAERERIAENARELAAMDEAAATRVARRSGG